MVSKNTSIAILLGVTLLIIVIGLVLKPIPQPQAYHNFADQRSWLGVPNAGDVLSNIPFALAGLWGLLLLFSPGQIHFVDARERWPWIGVSIGLILTAFGSGYYHLAPDNARLVWDRIPMTIVFMSFVAALIAERINLRLGLGLWPFLLVVGIYSVFQWHASELRGQGDLRMYAAVQVYAIVVSASDVAGPTPLHPHLGSGNRRRVLRPGKALGNFRPTSSRHDRRLAQWSHAETSRSSHGRSMARQDGLEAQSFDRALATGLTP